MAGEFGNPEVVQEEVDILIIGGGMAACGTAYEIGPWLDAAKAVRFGMDRQSAFEGLTINPAWILGIDNRTGSIEEGKDADIAIFSGHPFNIYTQVEITIVDGEIVYDRSQEPSPLEAQHEN